MRKRDIKSQDVNCPICDKLVKTRGLHAHLRLSHPLVDPILHLRKKVMSPGHVGDQVIFQLSNTIEGQYRVKWASIKTSDVIYLEELFKSWIEHTSPMKFFNERGKLTFIDTEEVGDINLIGDGKNLSWYDESNHKWDSLRNAPEPTDDE
jgi:hypothetical protein